LKDAGDEIFETRQEHEEHGRETYLTAISAPIKVIYQDRDILDLAYLREMKPIVQYTVLPENNVNSFFQNRAQYWRLSTNEIQECAFENCHNCAFSYPLCNQFNETQTKSKNSIAASLLTFLKSTENIQTPQIALNCSNSNVQLGCHQNQGQLYQTPVANGLCGNTNSYSYSQQINSRTNLPLVNINMMRNASQNAAFQTMSNGRYNNLNNNYGLYKQF
jgi:hypothetical protein